MSSKCYFENINWVAIVIALLIFSIISFVTLSELEEAKEKLELCKEKGYWGVQDVGVISIDLECYNPGPERPWLREDEE